MATTETQKNQVLAGLATGLTIKDACIHAGIGESTFYDIVNRDSEFSDNVEKAKIQLKTKGLKKIQEAGEKQWQAWAWILERKFKQEFGRVELTQEVSSEDIEKMDEDELDAYLNELESKLNEPSNEEEES